MPARSTHKVPRLLSAFFTRVARVGGAVKRMDRSSRGLVRRRARLSVGRARRACVWPTAGASRRRAGSPSESTAAVMMMGRLSSCLASAFCFAPHAPSLVLSVVARKSARDLPGMSSRTREGRGLVPRALFTAGATSLFPWFLADQRANERLWSYFERSRPPNTRPFFLFLFFVGPRWSRGQHRPHSARNNAKGGGAVYLSFISALSSPALQDGGMPGRAAGRVVVER